MFKKHEKGKVVSRMERTLFEPGDVVSCLTNKHGRWRRQYALAVTNSHSGNLQPHLTHGDATVTQAGRLIYVIGNQYTRVGQIVEGDWYTIFNNRVESGRE